MNCEANDTRNRELLFNSVDFFAQECSVVDPIGKRLFLSLFFMASNEKIETFVE